MNLLAAQGVKNPKREWFDPYGTAAFTRRAKETINLQAAKSFMWLHSQNRIPPWVEEYLEVDFVKAAAS